MAEINKRCPICMNGFTAHRIDRVYCSPSCKRKAFDAKHERLMINRVKGVTVEFAEVLQIARRDEPVWFELIRDTRGSNNLRAAYSMIAAFCWCMLRKTETDNQTFWRVAMTNASLKAGISQ